jgi:hypothetical protein
MATACFRASTLRASRRLGSGLANTMRNYIDFISSYCDSWCERCAFTDRCSHFAVTSALAMCDGDFEAALELAIGRAQQPGQPKQKNLRERMADTFHADEEPSAEELDAIGREMDAREAHVDRHVLAGASYDYLIAGRRWLAGHDGVDRTHVGLGHAVETIQRDLFLIHVKIKRALDGRHEDGDRAFGKRAVQADWNGSAKVALISIERSARAWREIGAALDYEAATVLAGTLAALARGMRQEFPCCMDFRRPGFDG